MDSFSEYQTAFRGTSGLFEQSARMAQELREKKEFQPPVSEYSKLFSEALKPVEKKIIDPIVLDSEKALEKFVELRKRKTSLQQTLATKEECIKKQEALLSSYYDIMSKVEQFYNSEELNTTIFKTSEEILKTSSSLYSTIQTTIQQTESELESITENLKPLGTLIAMLSSEEKQSIASGLQCAICLTNSVNRVFDSCGHTVCEQCSNRFQEKKCHICRSNFSFANPLYLSGVEESRVP